MTKSLTPFMQTWTEGTRPRRGFAHFTGRVEILAASFAGANGTREWHFALTPRAYADLETQLGWLGEAYTRALGEAGLEPGSAVLRRVFTSDPGNQEEAVRGWAAELGTWGEEPCALSVVGQAPPPPARVSLWAYHVEDARGPLDKLWSGPSLSLRRGALRHLWTTGLAAVGKAGAGQAGAGEQTLALFHGYAEHLAAEGCRLADHAVRTWIYLRDMDGDYRAMSGARNAVFERKGLTPDTHFLASTGIGGAGSDPAVRVRLEAYAVAGLRAEQVQFLSALDHLSPTALYGVAFERGVAVGYRDRRHLLLSGTASIDERGEILHPGQTLRQFDRVLENMAALLAPAGAGLGDLVQAIAYVRDPADLARVEGEVRRALPGVPAVTLLAPVCRPGWLVEIEGMAVVAQAAPELPEF